MPEEKVSEPDQIVARLAALPGRISRAVAGWSNERLRAVPAAGEWSVADVLAHVRAADDIQSPRLLMILARDNPPLPAFDERRWAEVAGYADLDFAASLAAFTLRRAELVAALRRAAAEDWRRTGASEARGTVTLLDAARIVVEHEEEHCAQLEAR